MMPSAPTFTIAKWKGTLYGFAELDATYDGTQAFNEIQGNGALAKSGTYAGDNSRMQLQAKNSRIGFNLESPRTESGMRGVGNLEMDFFGFDPGPFNANSVGNSEAGYFNNPTFRIRHAFVRFENPVVDILAGQYWELFGWQGSFQPATVELQGIPGEVYSRTAQIRLSRSIPIGNNALSLAIGAHRPIQRNSGQPDLQAGIKFDLKDWMGYKSTGGTSSGLVPLQIGVSGLLRQFKLQNPGTATAGPASTSDTITATGQAIAVDALLPIIPATKESKANALTILGEWTVGKGYNDVFTGFNSGGASTFGNAGGNTTNFPKAPAAPGFPDIDAGEAGILKNADGTATLEPIQWRSFIASIQYYLPIENGMVWVSGVYSDVKSNNVQLFNPVAGGVTSPTWFGQKWYSGNLFIDPTAGVRIGASVSYTTQDFSDNTSRNNVRGQLSFWYLFI
jgi:hypothetical protein